MEYERIWLIASKKEMLIWMLLKASKIFSQWFFFLLAWRHWRNGYL